MAIRVLLLRGSEVEKLLDMDDAIRAVEEAFREKGLGRVQMPPKVYLDFAKYGGDLRAMPSYIEAMEASAVKVVNSHPSNPSIGLPTVMATIILVDPRTGAPLSIMDGTYITAVRTGAAAAVATKYMGRGGSKVLGLIGAGVQAASCSWAISRVLKLDEVRVWSKDEASIARFAERVEGKLDAKVIAVKSAREAVEGSDVVVTATPSRSPIVMDEWVSEGTHINAIGADAPGKEELDPRILMRARVVVDDMEQACHGGEPNVPLSKGLITRDQIYGEIGEVVAGLKVGRASDAEVTVFASTGLAIQDAAVAKLVYERAMELNAGQPIDLIKPW